LHTPKDSAHTGNAQLLMTALHKRRKQKTMLHVSQRDLLFPWRRRRKP